jgi:hypothetical protein
MEIVEILSYFVNNKKDTIEVKFRLGDDSDDEIRIDEIDLKESDDFGYSLIVEDFDFFEDEEDDFLKDDDVNEDELKSFLNEYYMIYPERLPQKDLF